MCSASESMCPTLDSDVEKFCPVSESMCPTLDSDDGKFCPATESMLFDDGIFFHC